MKTNGVEALMQVGEIPQTLANYLAVDFMGNPPAIEDLDGEYVETMHLIEAAEKNRKTFAKCATDDEKTRWLDYSRLLRDARESIAEHLSDAYRIWNEFDGRREKNS